MTKILRNLRVLSLLVACTALCFSPVGAQGAYARGAVTLSADSALAAMNAMEDLVPSHGSGSALDSARGLVVVLAAEPSGLRADLRDVSGNAVSSPTRVQNISGRNATPSAPYVSGDFAVALVLARRYIKEHQLAINTDAAYEVLASYEAEVGTAGYRGSVVVTFLQHPPTPAPQGKLVIGCEDHPSFAVFFDKGIVILNPPAC
jgi:hypothetical protein